MRNLIYSLLVINIFFSKTYVFGQDGEITRKPYLQTRWAEQVSPTNALKEYPRPQLMRANWTNLNGLWEYAITSKDAVKPTAYDGQILVPYPLESTLSGVKKALQPDQNLWYKKAFDKPVINAGEHVKLNFGAVDYEATVFLNGTEVGKHAGGYTEFSFDITSALKDGSNEIEVKVADPSDQGVGPHGKQVLNPAINNSLAPPGRDGFSQRGVPQVDSKSSHRYPLTNLTPPDPLTNLTPPDPLTGTEQQTRSLVTVEISIKEDLLRTKIKHE
jgi:hypothetical protein